MKKNTIFVLDILFDEYDMETVKADMDTFSEWFTTLEEEYGIKVWTHENRLFIRKEEKMPEFRFDLYNNIILTVHDEFDGEWDLMVSPKEVKLNII